MREALSREAVGLASLCAREHAHLVRSRACASKGGERHLVRDSQQTHPLSKTPSSSSFRSREPALFLYFIEGLWYNVPNIHDDAGARMPCLQSAVFVEVYQPSEKKYRNPEIWCVRRGKNSRKESFKRAVPSNVIGHFICSVGLGILGMSARLT